MLGACDFPAAGPGGQLLVRLTVQHEAGRYTQLTTGSYIHVVYSIQQMLASLGCMVLVLRVALQESGH
jgi:hypothetical protein